MLQCGGLEEGLGVYLHTRASFHSNSSHMVDIIWYDWDFNGGVPKGSLAFSTHWGFREQDDILAVCQILEVCDRFWGGTDVLNPRGVCVVGGI